MEIALEPNRVQRGGRMYRGAALQGVLSSLSLLLFVFEPVSAQDVDELATDKTILQELQKSNGKTLNVDPQSPLGQYLRMFNFVQDGQGSLEITSEVIDRAKGIAEYFSAPPYSVGKQILATDSASGWITHRAYIRQVLPGNRYQVEIEEVLKYNQDMAPEQTRKVTRTMTADEIGRLNDPTVSRSGRQTHNSVTFDLQQDPYLQETVEKLNSVVDKNFPDFRKRGADLEAQQRDLFLEMQRIIAVMEHPGRASPEYSTRMQKMNADPFYGSRSGWAGSHLKYQHGVCFNQAAVQWWLVNQVARRAGIRMQLINGATLDGQGHGFNRVEFGQARKVHITDPSWNADWSGWRPGDVYDGNLYMEADEAFRDKLHDRNRRVSGVQGERVVPVSLRGQTQRGGMALLDKTRVMRSRVSSEVRSFGKTAGVFGLGYLFSEGLFTIQDSIRERRPVLDRLTAMADPGYLVNFAAGFGAFMAGAAGTQRILQAVVPRLAGGIVGRAAGLGVGIALADWLLTGQAPNPARVALLTGSFMVSGAVVRRLMLAVGGQVVKRAVLGAALGPIGWAILAVDLGLTLWLGRNIEELAWEGIQGLLHRKSPSTGASVPKGASTEVPAGPSMVEILSEFERKIGEAR